MLPEIIVAVVAALLTAVAAMHWLSVQTRETPDADPQTDLVALLFDDGVLHHASDPAISLFTMDLDTYYWGDLHTCLLARFPDFPDQAPDGEPGQIILHSTDTSGPTKALIRWRGDLCWVTLTESGLSELDLDIQNELAALRRVGQTIPYPIWQEDSSGNVFWHNEAYAGLSIRVAHKDAQDPKQPIFLHSDFEGPQRLSLGSEDNNDLDWYELRSRKIDDVRVFHATGINAIVKAEEAQRNFVQTLAKTFAHLSIGLAIFDRKGQLALFNPALLDLTGLSAEFLSARPTMLSFFDQLRENRQMPEPKNYKNWRQEIADVIAAATDDRYQEVWSLESGQTFKVKGRPHPDGATAFLIEDISAEMNVTRNFRAELDQAHNLLDAVDDTLAVFSTSGVLTLCNAPYRAMWQIDPDSTFAEITFRDCIRIWQEKCTNDPDWRQVEETIGGYGGRNACEIVLQMDGGKRYMCKVTPMPAGSTLVRFSRMAPETVTQTRAVQSQVG